MDLFIAEVANVPPDSILTSVPAPVFRFMDLPPELRVKVYEELVVVGKVFFTPDTCERQESRFFRDIDKVSVPCLSVLRTSKTIYEEAQQVYHGKNCFVLPSTWHSLLPLNRYDLPARRLFAEAAFDQVKHIAVMLCPRTKSFPLTMYATDWNDHDAEMNSTTFESMTEEERMESAHKFALDWAVEHYEEIVMGISEFQNLRIVELDFTNAYCPLGCCRAAALEQAWVQRNVQKVRMHGFRNSAELKKVKRYCSENTKLTESEIDQRLDIIDMSDQEAGSSSS